MSIPKSLKIGGHIIKVELGDVEDDDYGEFDPDTNTIVISSGLSQSQKEVTLLHEMMHVLNAKFDDEWPRSFMESFSQQLYQVLKDNKLNFK